MSMSNDEKPNKYVPRNFLDSEKNGVIVPGTWREADDELFQVAPQLGRHSSASAVQNRNDLADFFLTTGAVPWQHNMINK